VATGCFLSPQRPGLRDRHPDQRRNFIEVCPKWKGKLDINLVRVGRGGAEGVCSSCCWRRRRRRRRKRLGKRSGAPFVVDRQQTIAKNRSRSSREGVVG